MIHSQRNSWCQLAWLRTHNVHSALKGESKDLVEAKFLWSRLKAASARALQCNVLECMYVRIMNVNASTEQCNTRRLECVALIVRESQSPIDHLWGARPPHCSASSHVNALLALWSNEATQHMRFRSLIQSDNLTPHARTNARTERDAPGSW